MRTRLTISLLIVISGTSCAGAARPAADTATAPAKAITAPASSTFAPIDPTGTPDVTPLPMDQLPSDAEAMVARVQGDLAQRLSAPPGATLTLLSAESVTWPDTSLGCPRPDTGYLQVETPGFVITLLANGGRYIYHTDLADNYLLCVNGESGDPIDQPDPGEIKDGQPWMPVDPVEPGQITPSR